MFQLPLRKSSDTKVAIIGWCCIFATGSSSDHDNKFEFVPVCLSVLSVSVYWTELQVVLRGLQDSLA